MTVTAAQLLELLKVRHRKDVMIPECKTGGTYIGGFRRMDLWVLRTSYVQPAFLAYEIKVSRADFVQDTKWREYLGYCTQFSFVCPWGMIQPEEVPAEAGVIWASKNLGRLYNKKKAPERDVVPPVELFMYLLMSRVRITRERYEDYEDPLAYWKHWLEYRKETKDLGRRVSRGVAGHCARMETQMHLLKVQNERYAWVKEWLEELGVTPHEWGWKEKLRARAAGGISQSPRRELGHALHILAGVAEELEELERGSQDDRAVGDQGGTDSG